MGKKKKRKKKKGAKTNKFRAIAQIRPPSWIPVPDPDWLFEGAALQPSNRKILPPPPLPPPPPTPANAAMTCFHWQPRARSRKCPSPAVHLPLQWPGRYIPRLGGGFGGKRRGGGAYPSRRKALLAPGVIISTPPPRRPHVFIV